MILLLRLLMRRSGIKYFAATLRRAAACFMITMPLRLHYYAIIAMMAFITYAILRQILWRRRRHNSRYASLFILCHHTPPARYAMPRYY